MDKVDLDKLEALYDRAMAVVPLRYIHARYTAGDPLIGLRNHIGLRHDVDDRGWDSVLDMARWEHAREIHSTYYFLHTAPYWGCDTMRYTLREIAGMGHEIGLHNNALVEGLATGQNPWDIFHDAVDKLRFWSGVEVTSTAAHGDSRCYNMAVVNYAMFDAAPIKPPWRTAEQIGIRTAPLPHYGIEFCGDWLPRANYISDSGDQWNPCPPDEVEFPAEVGPLFILQHPDWWRRELFRA